jgi:predicted O-methyltransferase YrrM
MGKVKNLIKHSIMTAMTRLLKNSHSVILSYWDDRAPVLDLVKQIQAESGMVLLKNEAYQLYAVARSTQKIPGDMAEVGVYRGGSARLISEVKGDRQLYLFDSFEGLPELSDKDSHQFHARMYTASYEEVSKYLSRLPGVFLYKGWFPGETAQVVKNKTFSFVHLDVDLYEATRDALEFFYPRLNKGGVLISHDYSNSGGVRKAFDGFFSDKPEPLIELGGSQVLIVKT